MSEFTPLREELETLAARAPLPDFGELKHRVTRRRRRRRAMAVAALAAVISGYTLALTGLYDVEGIAPVERPTPPTPAPAQNGWVAVNVRQGGGDIYLVRPGEDPRRLEVAGWDAASEACPAWSPEGTRLMFGRLTGSSDTASGDPELVIVPVDQDGEVGTPTVIGLDGFEVLEGFGDHPCGTWAPDGRWVALAGTGDVWVVDTQTGAIRRLPDLRPSDLEWRPGTDELAIAGDIGTNRGAPTLSTPVTVYSVSTGELRQLAVEAAQVSWSPAGRSLVYEGGELETARSLRLVDADGTDERLLVADAGSNNHGIGPVWSPTGDRIAYQRLRCAGGQACGGHERHEVVLVSVTDGTERVIEPPNADGHEWYPFTVSWSPDGTSLLYAAWHQDGQPLPDGGETLPGDVMLAVPADNPSDATVLIDSIDPGPDSYSHIWTPIQMWGRHPK